MLFRVVTGVVCLVLKLVKVHICEIVFINVSVNMQKLTV